MMKNDFEKPTYQEKKRQLDVKCIVVLLILIVGFLPLFSSCNRGFELKDPKTVTYREKVSDTGTSEIWRNVKCELVSVSYDTVLKVKQEQSKQSTLETEISLPRVQTIPKDRVDLNDYLGCPNDETDWNYTEIDGEMKKYLDSLGIYWDNEKQYWRKKK